MEELGRQTHRRVAKGRFPRVGGSDDAQPLARLHDDVDAIQDVVRGIRIAITNAAHR